MGSALVNDGVQELVDCGVDVAIAAEDCAQLARRQVVRGIHGDSRISHIESELGHNRNTLTTGHELLDDAMIVEAVDRRRDNVLERQAMFDRSVVLAAPDVQEPLSMDIA